MPEQIKGTSEQKQDNSKSNITPKQIHITKDGIEKLTEIDNWQV